MTTIFFLATGIFSWTLLEYIIHRFLGHRKEENNPITSEHHRHHREGDYFASLWKKSLLAALIFPLLTAAIGIFFGWLSGAMFSVGLVGMYLFYEAFHKTLHVWAPLTFYGRWARKHHFYHHFKNPAKNHGVTSPIWDIAFGTYYPAKTRLRVPQKMAMRWLLDAPVKYRNDYEVFPQNPDISFSG